MNSGTATLWVVIGWTMLHFLWTGGLVAFATGVVMRLLRAAPGEARYAVALAGLFLLAILPPAIALRLARQPSAHWSLQPALDPAQERAMTGARVNGTGSATDIDETIRPPDKALAVGPASSPASVDRSSAWWFNRRTASLNGFVAHLPWLWLVGSPLTFAWLALGLAGAERLRRQSIGLDVNSDLFRLCQRLAGTLGIARHVAVAVCDRLATPVLVGIARPLILLPAHALGGWAPEQIEMVLLHELAHVRRWDNLVNLFQRFVEALYFFHPAVWIASGWVRQERELCCDQIVVAQTGRARRYAELLLFLAGEPPPSVAISLAAVPRRKQLVRRIHHILVPPEEHPMKLARGLVLVVTAVILGPAAWMVSLAWSEPFQEARPSVVDSATGTRPSAPAEQAKLNADKSAKSTVMLQGKPLAEWIAALRDRDPAARKRALDVLAQVTHELAGEQFPELRANVNGVVHMDKDPSVRKAAQAVATLFLSQPTAASRRRSREERARAVPPTVTPLRLVDVHGEPVAGATVSGYFWDLDGAPASFSPAAPARFRCNGCARRGGA